MPVRICPGHATWTRTEVRLILVEAGLFYYALYPVLCQTCIATLDLPQKPKCRKVSLAFVRNQCTCAKDVKNVSNAADTVKRRIRR